MFSSKILVLTLIINFFSLNFISIKFEGERVSSSKNKHTLGGMKGAPKRTRTKKEVGKGRSKLGNLEQTYFLNVPFILLTKACRKSQILWSGS